MKPLPPRRCPPTFIATLLLTSMLLAGLAGCAGGPALPQSPAALDVVVVRHAEKDVDHPRDPSLSTAGRARALRLAGLAATRGVDAVYSSDFRRTRDTAATVASAAGVAIRLYDAAEPAAAFVARLRMAHAGGRLLVVGHSNTVPAIVAALCECAVEPIAEDTYDNLFEVRLERGAAPVLRHTRY